MKRVFWMISLTFFLILAAMIKLTVFDRWEIASSSYNPRMYYEDANIQRGEVKDINGQVIAESVLDANGNYIRQFPRARMAAHITGYNNSKGKTGVEAAENFELEKIHNEILQRVAHLFTGQEIQGNDVVLSIDMDIQSVAGDLLGSKKGAVVVMEPSTGRILALQAYPDFNPNEVQSQWDTLREDENSPLVNRATQGLYPPGSTFKIVTALAALEYMPDWESFTYECTGQASFEGKIIHCYNEKAHGTVNLKSAVAQSCNCYFAEIGTQIGAGKLRKKADSLYANEAYGFELAYNKTKVSLNKDSTESELVETSIGQGKTLATPLYMCMIAAAVANDGIMMQPYIVDHVEYYTGKSSKTTVPKKLKQVFSSEDAEIITDMMVEVVNNGTGTAAQVSGVAVAGKTGTAENATGSDHSWFIGFAPAENPQIAVAVMIENSDTGGRATPIAGKVIKAALEKYGY